MSENLTRWMLSFGVSAFIDSAGKIALRIRRSDCIIDGLPIFFLYSLFSPIR